MRDGKHRLSINQRRLAVLASSGSAMLQRLAQNTEFDACIGSVDPRAELRVRPLGQIVVLIHLNFNRS